MSFPLMPIVSPVLGAAGAGRVYHYAESVALSTTTSTSDQTKVTLTFQPDANSQYVYIWSAQVNANSTAADVRVQLDSGATVLAFGNVEDKDSTDFHPVSGLASETFGSSPSSVTLTLKYSTEDTSTFTNAGIREARIFVLKLEAGDVYAENTADQTNTTTSLSTALTLNWTPPSAGDYILFGSCEYRFSSTSGEVYTAFIHAGTPYGAIQARPRDTTNYHPGLHAVYLPSLSGAQSATVEWARSATATGTAYCRRASLLALRVDGFSGVDYAESRVRQSTTQSVPPVTAVETATITVGAEPYLILGVCVRDHNSTSNSAITRIDEGVTRLVEETIQEATIASATIDLPAGMWAQAFVFTPAGGSTTFRISYRTESSSSTGISDAALFIIPLT
jgi:hypothetical protein